MIGAQAAPRLLLLCEYPTINGGEQSMLSTFDTIQQARFSITVACPTIGPLPDCLREREIPIIPFETHDPHGRRLGQDERREGLKNLLAEHRPDLFHANSLSTGRLSGPLVRELAIPSLAHLRDIIGLSRRAVDDLNQHQRLLAVSRATRDFHVGQGVDPQKITVLHNGVDLDRFRPNSAPTSLREQLDLPPSARLVVTIGQIGLRKGHDVLVDAAVRLAGRLLNVHWLVVGERFSQKAESQRFEVDLREAAAGPLTGHLHLLGWRDDVDRILREADLLVHPARQEPLGRVLLEAAASGLPVVATDVGGTREIFPKDGEGAILVPPDDAATLAESVLRILTDDTLRHAMQRSGRRRAEEAFNVRRAAAELVGHYQELLDR